jgi:hypothetical protein
MGMKPKLTTKIICTLQEQAKETWRLQMMRRSLISSLTLIWKNRGEILKSRRMTTTERDLLKKKRKKRRRNEFQLNKS